MFTTFLISLEKITVSLVYSVKTMEFLAIAERAAREAGNVVMKYRGMVIDEQYKDETD